jgi:hypothetical protein
VKFVFRRKELNWYTQARTKTCKTKPRYSLKYTDLCMHYSGITLLKDFPCRTSVASRHDLTNSVQQELVAHLVEKSLSFYGKKLHYFVHIARHEFDESSSHSSFISLRSILMLFLRLYLCIPSAHFLSR